tara:strand:- start:44 stop:409 length:366 start_codon:yes stop_codon:yes gene_type:complete
MRDKHELTRDDKGRWKSGVSGNPNGRPKNTMISDIIKDVGDSIDETNMHTLNVLIVKKVYELALSGNLRAIEFITERLEGKVPIKEIEKNEELPIGFDLVVFKECTDKECPCVDCDKTDTI